MITSGFETGSYCYIIVEVFNQQSFPSGLFYSTSTVRYMTATTETDNYIYRISRLLHWLCAICFVQLVVSMPMMLDAANNSAERREVYHLARKTPSRYAEREGRGYKRGVRRTPIAD